LIHVVLSKKYIKATVGNLNNHIGVPLTLLSTAETEIGIVEMGANHKNEIEFLCELLCLTMDILQILVKRTWKDRCRCKVKVKCIGICL
jgi:UDP-N-acetylmuramyl pentapeptide synthase